MTQAYIRPAQIRPKDKGGIVHTEAQTFTSKALAKTWLWESWSQKRDYFGYPQAGGLGITS